MYIYDKIRKIIIPITFVILLITATLGVWKINGSPVIGIDDSNIFFSYAENLTAGNGITYANNGERVEGYTSSLWMIICSAMFFIGFNELGVLILSVFIAAATQLIFLKTIQNICKRTERSRPFIYQAAFAIIILFSPAYITWMTITLMDTVLWGFILASITYFIVSPPDSKKSRVTISILFALAPLARPEAFVIVPAFIAILWLRLQSCSYSNPLKNSMFAGIVFSASVLLLTLFRISYFGYPLPNTYYAKVSPSLLYNLKGGLKYLNDFFSSGTIIKLWILFSIISSMVWIWKTLAAACSEKRWKMIISPAVSASAAVALSVTVLVITTVLTGGDHFPMFRFFQPVYPIMCLVPIIWAAEHELASKIGLRFNRIYFKNSLLKTTVGSLALTLFAVYMFWYSSENSWVKMIRHSPIDFQFRIAERYMKRGEIIRDIFSKTDYMPSVGVISAGGIARSYPGKIFDLMGLNDEIMAHRSGDRKGIRGHSAFRKDVFFEEKPDILLSSPPVPPATENFFTKVLKNIYYEPQFKAGWRYGTIGLKNSPETVITAYISGHCIDVIKDSKDAFFTPAK